MELVFNASTICLLRSLGKLLMKIGDPSRSQFTEIVDPFR